MKTSEELLKDLNESQQKAVEYCEGPELVIAGAGSGKTRVLTYKIAYLLQKGMKPYNILALTFTNKAAREMKERIATLVGDSLAMRLNMGTFHSQFFHILRHVAQHVGYSSNFTVYDEADSRSLVKSLIKDMKLDDKLYKPSSMHARISLLKNRLILPDDYAASDDRQKADAQSRIPAFSQLYAAYQQRLKQANAMDFDDLLVQTYLIFRDHDDIRRRYADHFSYVLVDEYQDTNYVQQRILLQLTQESHQVCVVGDDYQSIYGFRGADIDNILDFQNIFKDARLFKLEQNYRSTQLIVQAANSLMKHNKWQIDKNVFSRKDVGDKLTVKYVSSDKEEAFVVCKDIQRLMKDEQCDYSSFAILYRTNSQSRSFEEEMRKQAIPYRIYGGLSFYQRKEIKDIIAYFRVVCNPDDEEALRRIINYPARGIGETTVQKVAAAAHNAQVSLWAVITQPELYQLPVSKATLNKLASFSSLISSFTAHLGDTDAYALGRDIIMKSGIRDDIYSGTDADSLSRQENMEEFLAGMNDFVAERQEEDRTDAIGLPDFLQEVSLLTDLDSDDTSDSKVSLMTVHAAKGLEFPVVFIVGMEENIFPSPRCTDSTRNLEEERRLFYVAITRAERHCIVTSAKNRWRYGHMEFDTPSRFLRDIDPSLMHVVDEASEAESKAGFGRRNWFLADDYEPDQPYSGVSPWDDDRPIYSNRWQNSRPVASQFMADKKPKITAPRRPEKAVDPFSESFKRRLQAHGGNLKRVSEVIANGGRQAPDAPKMSEVRGLHEGSVIEHQRFGVGTVLKLEGSGESEKATVEFKNSGTKQLLLKFAKFTIIS